MGQLGGREFAQSGAVRHPCDSIAGGEYSFRAPHQLVAIVRATVVASASISHCADLTGAMTEEPVP